MSKLKKKIIFTGGGSAGHVTVNLALIPKFIEEGWTAEYIGSEGGIEKQLVHDLNNNLNGNLSQVTYNAISTGKLRRYLDWNNIKDPFKVMKGVLQAYRLIKKQRPNVIFSKGGFVSVPVILGAWLNRVPVVIHESDITPGLANKISIPFSTKVCTTFPETIQHLRTKKAEYVGAIVREELKRGSAERGQSLCEFTKDKPILFIVGGSLGSQRINQVIRASLDQLLPNFQIVHICGKGQIDRSLSSEGYKQFEYVNQELPDVMAMSDLVISRAGSNLLFELLALRKPMLLIPLSKKASRGDQLLNAQSFKKMGYCEVLFEEDLSEETLLQGIKKVFENRFQYVENMKKTEEQDPIQKVIEIIEKVAK